MLNFPYSELTGRKLINNKFIKIDRTGALELPSNRSGWLDTNSQARLVVEIVEQLDTSEIEGFYKGGGSAPYPPKMMLALLFYCYAKGIFASRQIEQATYELIPVLYITGGTPTNDSYITGTQVCELLKKLAELKLAIPITLVLDNPRYQNCKIVQNLAEELGIELLYLPPYSPNLNLIERLWKFVKKKCLYAKYYEDFSQFSSAISDCLNEAHLKHNQELDSLLTLRFQTFEKSQILKV